MSITQSRSRNNEKIWYSLEWGKAAGHRIATGVFTYVKPKDQVQKNHNKEALLILETKRSQMILERQAINSGYIPQHKVKYNFFDYYAEFVKLNARKGNRHLENSLNAFKKFVGKDFLSPSEITETICERFRTYLLDHYNGETPSGYFMRFKRVLKAAKKDGYFKVNPAEDLLAKTGAIKKIKEILSEQDYIQLMQTPCLNHEIKKAFVFSLYSGLRWADVKLLKWENIRKNILVLRQKKTGIYFELPLHEMAVKLLGEAKTEGLVFKLPTQDGANKLLRNWCKSAGLDKHITWHCARHSFSVLLQRKGIDVATVAGMLGHTSTKYVHQTYKRYNQDRAMEAIATLPSS